MLVVIKENVGCVHAIYSNTVKSVLNYFNKQGSTVTMAALDISKAFDKVNHYVLFSKLLDRRVPMCIRVSYVGLHYVVPPELCILCILLYYLLLCP